MVSWLSSKIFTVVAVLVVLWFGVRALDLGTQKAALNREVSELQTKINTLTKDNKVLEKFISFTHDADFLAREVRRRLNFRAADEHVAFVYPSEDKTASASEELSEKSLLAKVKDWLYDVFQK
ncbi:MAG: septum formation initiator family protein [Patescibacteria group bacterium]